MGQLCKYLGLLCLAAALGPLAKAQAETPNRLARGRYLVENVGMCQDCHTPMLPTGEYDRTRWMKGTVLLIQPAIQVPNWRKESPDLTSAGPLFQNWGEKGLLQFLTTGLDPSGRPAGPPMPRYRFNAEDAQAVIAYLRSLK